MWIDGPPIPPISPTIRVVQKDGESTFVPLRGLGLAGTTWGLLAAKRAELARRAIAAGVVSPRDLAP